MSLVADLGGAERGVGATLALLFARTRTGQGGSAEVSLAEAARWFALPRSYGLTKQGGLLGGAYAPYNLYASADGWLAIAAITTTVRCIMLS